MTCKYDVDDELYSTTLTLSALAKAGLHNRCVKHIYKVLVKGRMGIIVLVST